MRPRSDRPCSPALGALVAAALVGLAAPARAAGFGPGEQMVIEVDYSGIKAGTATITVGAPVRQGAADAWPVVTIANTESLFSVYPLHDKFVSWWAPDLGHSVAWDFYADEGHKLRRERCKMGSPAPGKAQVQRATEDNPPSLQVYDIDPTAQDIAGAFFLLRAKPLAPGMDVSVPVFTGYRSWSMNAHVGEPVEIEVPAGKFDALPMDVEVHFQGKLTSKRNLKVWVSNDARHVLLKMEADLALGSLHGTLVEYHPGNDVAER